MNRISIFPTRARFLHWSMAALILGMLFLGVSMVDTMSVWRTSALNLHKACGFLLLVMVGLRLANRLTFRAPDLPAVLPRLQVIAANASHVALYAAMIAMPVIGCAMQGAGAIPVVLPGDIVLPGLVEPNLALYGLLRTMHGGIAYALFALILLHVAAALHHRFIRRDGVMAMMTGGGGRRERTGDLNEHANGA